MKITRKKIGSLRWLSRMMFVWMIILLVFPIIVFTDSCSILIKKSPEGYAIAGMKCVDKKDYTKAIRNYSKAIELNPIMYQAYWDRANAEILIGDSLNRERAIDDLGKYIDSNPPRKMLSQAYIKRAEVLLKSGYKAESCQDLEEACSLNESPKSCEQYRLNCKK